VLKLRSDKANYGFIIISLVEAYSTQNTNAFLECTVHIKIQNHLVYTTILSWEGVLGNKPIVIRNNVRKNVANGTKLKLKS